jgi:hypothetical protein
VSFLELLISETSAIAGGVARITDDIWAIHGVIPVDGDVILAEFDTYDEARSVLGELPAAPLVTAAPAWRPAGAVAGSA